MYIVVTRVQAIIRVRSALAELLLLPRAGTIEGGKATGKSASRPVPASLTALPHGGRHVDLGRRKRGKNEVEAAG